MATLRNVNGASLVPDFSAGLNNLFKGIEARRAEEQALAKQQQIQQILGGLTGQPVGAAAGGVDPGFVESIDQGNGVTTYPIGVEPYATPESATPGINPLQPNPNRDAALLRLTALDPKMGKEIREVLESGDARKIEQVKHSSRS